MSAVAFGVLPGAELRRSAAPMAEAASRYLPIGAAWFVTFGAVMALTTSVNATMLVPSRVGIMLAEDGLAPQFIGRIAKKTGTPIIGLTLTLIVTLLLLVSGQVSLALNIAVFALVVLYFLHSVALLMLPRANPSLYASVTLRMPLIVQRIAAVVSLLFMGTLIAVQLAGDVGVLRRLSFRERIEHASLTTIELVIFWGAIGAVLYLFAARKRRAAAIP
jgi:amino acid transporter